MPIEQTLKKIEYDISTENCRRARDRLHGLILTYPDNLSLRRKLGDIYWKLQYPEMAGRYWYLEEDKSPTMTTACAVFERTFGNDPLHILIALKFRGDIKSIEDTFPGRTLLALHTQAKQKHGYYVDFQKQKAERYIQRASNKSRHDKMLGIGCIVGLVIGIGLMIVGLVTVVAWLFGARPF